MQCPFDATTLQVVNRSGVEIDWCPSCKGVWLERGELDKLIDQIDQIDQTARAMSMPPPAPMAPPGRSVAPPPPARPTQTCMASPDSPFSPHSPDWSGDRRYDARPEGPYRGKKRKGFLSEMFDF